MGRRYTDSLQSRHSNHSCDPRRYGQGGTKDVQSLLDELHAGVCHLEGEGRELRRIVEVVHLQADRHETLGHGAYREAYQRFAHGSGTSLSDFPASWTQCRLPVESTEE